MANRIIDLYNANKATKATEGGPEVAKVDAGMQKDKTPYSTGIDASGPKEIDEAGVSKVEGLSTYSPGNRYGFQGAALGGGSKYVGGFTDTSLYSNSVDRT